MSRFQPAGLFLLVCFVFASDPSAVQRSAREVRVTVDEGTSMAIAVSPDGQTIAMDLQGAIWTMPVAGGPATRITDEFSDARQPAWAPDGKHVAFQAFRAGDWDIWMVARDGSGVTQLTSGPFDDREPHFAPDGSALAFSSDRSGNYDIWTLDLRSRAAAQVSKDAGDDFYPTWSPDSREIAYASSRQSSPGVYASTRSGAERLVTGADGSIGAPSWSPDGTHMAFSVVSGGSSSLMIDGEAVSTGEDVFPFRAQWTSPRTFLYTADGKIKRRTIGQREPAAVNFTAEFVLKRDGYDVKRRDFDSATPTPVRGIVKPVLSPDGKHVAFSALGDLWTMAIGERPSRVTNDRFLDTDPVWSPDGRTLAYSSDREGGMDIWTYDVQTRSARRLTELPTSDMAPAWSPDGKRIAFVSINSLFTGEIQTVDVESRQVLRIHDNVFGPSDPQWSADGTRIMFASLKRYSNRFREGINQFVTFPVDGGPEKSWTVRPHRGSDVRAGGGPVWSPNGKHVAFILEGALTIMDVTPSGEPAGEPRAVTTEIAHSPSWSGDSSRLLYLSSDRLRMVPVRGGAPTDVPLDLTYTRARPSGQLVVRVGRLVDGRSEGARSDVDILIDGTRITAIEPRRERPGARVVDATGLTAIPGLIEMHGHLVKEYGEAMGRAWLAYGVTTVRNPAAMTPYMSIEDREAVEAGVRVGPRIIASGYQMDGTRIYYPLGLSISSPTQLEWELERVKRLDLDFIKTYVRLPDLFQKRVIEFAHQNGLPVTSHELYPGVGVGMDGTEHTSGTSRRGYSPKISPLQFAYGDVVDLIAKSGLQFTPTASLGGGFRQITQSDSSLLTDPRYQTLFPAWIVKPAARRERGGGGFGAGEPRGPRMALDILKAGGMVLAGTDSPISPYGLSLQTELEVLARGGFTPLQALQTATLRAAEALGASADLGTIEPGKLADIVLVDGDPLADITSTRKVRTVIKNGEVFSLEALLNPRSSKAGTASGR
jgi:Tol biopolymer transport system component